MEKRGFPDDSKRMFNPNDPLCISGEAASANSVTNAKSMALIASVMAQGGKNDRIKLMSEETYSRWLKY